MSVTLWPQCYSVIVLDPLFMCRMVWVCGSCGYTCLLTQMSVSTFLYAIDRACVFAEHSWRLHMPACLHRCVCDYR